MNDFEASVRSALESVAAFDLGRLEFHADFDQAMFNKIDVGVVFVHLTASPSSRAALLQLGRVLAEFDADFRIKVIVLDSSMLHPIFRNESIGSHLGGWGEVFWVRSGRLLRVSSGPDPEQAFPEHVQLLLNTEAEKE